jgi:hypothetical protein
MLDPHSPDRVRTGASDEPDVAPGVDGVVLEAHACEQAGGPVDGPALDEPRGIECARGIGVEVAGRLSPQLLAPHEYLPHLRRRVRDGEVAAGDAADLAVGVVGGERLVDLTEPVEDRVEGALVHHVVAEVDEDRHAHDLLDPAYARRFDCDRHHAFFARRIAACSDWANA